MEVFFSIRALSSWYFNLKILKTGPEWVLGENIFWNCTFRFSKLARTSVFILKNSDFLLEAELICSCTVTLYIYNPLIGTVHIVVTFNVPVSCLKQIAFALKSKSTSSQKWYKFSLRLRAEKEGHCESWSTNP